MLTPSGERLTQAVVKELSQQRRLLLLCGRYEGFDERIRLGLRPRELSIGDFVCNGGEVPAMVVIDTVVRYVPGVLGDPESLAEESHNDPGRLEYPQYTRPRVFRGMAVPEVLLSGDHGAVARWRQEQSLLRSRRPLDENKQTATTIEEGRIMKNRLIALVEEAALKKEIPHFEIGDTVDVHQRILEGQKERVQIFNGVVIARRGEGMREMFTVRRIVQGEGVERQFPLHSPKIAKIEVEAHRQGPPRQAVLSARSRRQGDAPARTPGQDDRQRRRRQESREVRGAIGDVILSKRINHRDTETQRKQKRKKYLFFLAFSVSLCLCG